MCVREFWYTRIDEETTEGEYEDSVKFGTKHTFLFNNWIVSLDDIVILTNQEGQKTKITKLKNCKYIRVTIAYKKQKNLKQKYPMKVFLKKG